MFLNYKWVSTILFHSNTVLPFSIQPTRNLGMHLFFGVILRSCVPELLILPHSSHETWEESHLLLSTPSTTASFEWAGRGQECTRNVQLETRKSIPVNNALHIKAKNAWGGSGRRVIDGGGTHVLVTHRDHHESKRECPEICNWGSHRRNYRNSPQVSTSSDRSIVVRFGFHLDLTSLIGGRGAFTS